LVGGFSGGVLEPRMGGPPSQKGGGGGVATWKLNTKEMCLLRCRKLICR